MTDIVVDLRTRVITSDLAIWRLFPGSGYRLLDKFQETGTVFLDMPGLSLPAGIINEQCSDLTERIMVSHEVRKWLTASRRAKRTQSKAPSPPSREPATYRDERQPKSLSNHKGAVIAFFGRAKAGDLVVVPSNLASRRVLVGEFLKGPDHRVDISTDQYNEEPIPARIVKWYPSINELELPLRLSEVIRRPNPFVAFDRTLYRDIFDRTFDSYAFEDTYSARFDTASAHFRMHENLSFGLLSEAIAFILQQVEENRTDEISSLMSAAIAPRDASYQPQVSVNINSPGSILLNTRQFVPFILSAILAVAADAQPNSTQPTVRVINSQTLPEHDQCTPEVDRRVRDVLELMGLETWKEACRRSRQLRDGTRLEGPARLVPDVEARQETNTGR